MSKDVIVSALAEQLLASTPAQQVVGPYRLARLVARVLVSRHLRQRHKWCDLARGLSADAAVEPRLIQQAMRWLAVRSYPGSTAL